MTALAKLPGGFGWKWEQHGWGCLDYERWLVIDREAHRVLHRTGRKRAGAFRLEPVYAAGSQYAEAAAMLRNQVQQHLRV